MRKSYRRRYRCLWIILVEEYLHDVVVQLQAVWKHWGNQKKKKRGYAKT